MAAATARVCVADQPRETHAMTAIITVTDDEILIAPLGDGEDLPPEDNADADRAAALARLGLTLADLPF